ncbi:Hypothetical predicted protein, partial [Mytilus galloprovincialis]
MAGCNRKKQISSTVQPIADTNQDEVVISTLKINPSMGNIRWKRNTHLLGNRKKMVLGDNSLN